MGAGRAPEALHLLDALPPRIDVQEIDAFMLGRLRLLGAALRVKALALAGQRVEAVKEGRRLRPTCQDSLEMSPVLTH